MPRGTSPLDEATIQGRVWTPARLPPNGGTSGRATLEAWYDAQDFGTITVATGVSQWNDKSGNGRHLTQGTAANQPSFQSRDALAPYNNLSFDGTNDSLSVASSFVTPILLAGGSTCIMTISRFNAIVSSPAIVTEATAASNNGFMSLIRLNSTSNASISFTNDAATAIYTVNVSLGFTPNTGTPNIYSYTHEQAAVTAYFPGATPAPTTPNSAFGAFSCNNFSLGALNRLTPASFFNGRIFEVIVMGCTDASFPQQMRWKAEAYLLWKYQTLLLTANRVPLFGNPSLFPRPPEIGA